jgi:hypothetical protein
LWLNVFLLTHLALGTGLGAVAALSHLAIFARFEAFVLFAMEIGCSRVTAQFL